MICWRVTKYDPKNRGHNGKYLKEEWTSSSDINKIYNTKKFIIEEYMEIEDAYVGAILQIMECLKLSSLRITALEKHGFSVNQLIYTSRMKELYEIIQPGYLVAREDISDLVRLILRENIWCKLEDKEMFVHFGYDYYMYIGSSKPCSNAICAIEKSGMFVESIESSPWS